MTAGEFTFLRDRGAEILAEWERRAAGADAASAALLREGLPALLGALQRWLEAGEPPEGAAQAWAALRQALAGRGPPPGLPQVARELRVVRETVLRWALSPGGAAGGPAVPVEALLRLEAGLDAVLAAGEEELHKADQRKADFLAVLSHELRNPLTPIRNSLYLLEHTPADGERATRARQVLRRQTEHLTRLVDDLLDVTRIARGKTELRCAGLDLRDVVRRTTDDLHTLFEAAGLDLRLEQPVGPVWVEGDAVRLAQVLGNLLQNAAKFTPAGGTVTVRLAAAGGQATLSVRDTGIGMEPGQEHRMFEAFIQGGPGVGRGGLGLGLALVKGLVELHGGTVRAVSEGPGRGSEFAVTLPLAEPPAPAEPPPPAATAGLLVLVVEDDLDTGQTLADVLALSGHRVRLARDAGSGLELARALRPDVILCDVGLPDLDGYALARRLRAEPVLAQVRLIAITGFAQPEDRERARQAGFDAHLPKPPAPDELRALLARP